MVAGRALETVLIVGNSAGREVRKASGVWPVPPKNCAPVTEVFDLLRDEPEAGPCWHVSVLVGESQVVVFQ